MRRWVLAGLVLSLGGDIALLWPREGFLPGLVSFLLAHLAYLIGFTRERRFAAAWAPFTLYAVVAGTILALLWPGVPGALRVPVAIYVVCLASMAAQAAVLWRTGVERAGVLALGGALFVASDALLATNKFAAELPRRASGSWRPTGRRSGASRRGCPRRGPLRRQEIHPPADHHHLDVLGAEVELADAREQLALEFRRLQLRRHEPDVGDLALR